MWKLSSGSIMLIFNGNKVATTVILVITCQTPCVSLPTETEWSLCILKHEKIDKQCFSSYPHYQPNQNDTQTQSLQIHSWHPYLAPSPKSVYKRRW